MERTSTMEQSADFVSAVIEMIENVGFPIFISLFLLYRMEAKLNAVVEAVNQLTAVLSQKYH
ncbi:YvrJ family protein [Marinilactibacillus psychrotolerans]|uniref:YvrJ family protein n=1 Tax=Marinilactibacillus psychrotolerans TaxID=191770 RepID=UPI0039AF15FD